MFNFFLAADAAQASSLDFLGLALFGAGIGAGLIIVGAGYGISKIAAAAVESMARQPEVAGTINMAMLLTAAFIEGVSFFAAVVCFQMVGNVSEWIGLILHVAEKAQ